MVNGADTVTESIAIEASTDDTTTEATTGTSSWMDGWNVF